jgi:hypothetical protein
MDGLDQHDSGLVHTDSHNVREDCWDYIRIRHELDRYPGKLRVVVSHRTKRRSGSFENEVCRKWNGVKRGGETPVREAGWTQAQTDDSTAPV